MLLLLRYAYLSVCWLEGEVDEEEEEEEKWLS